MSIFICYLITRAPLKKIQINKKSFNKKNILINVQTLFELLRFSMHSVASGLQNNQAFLISRIFLITFAGTAFAGQMEMYQRPMIWMLTFGSQISGLFFYPFVVKQMELKLSSSDNRLIIDRKVFIYTGFYTLGFLGLLFFTFPILFWITFGAEVSISLLYSIFWVSIFASRFLAVLFSSWLLAKNNVKSAMVGEALLYMPSIIFFGLIPIFFSKNAYDMTYVYFAVIGLSSVIQMIYFLHKLKFYETFKLKQ